ncbi:MAG: alpha/beta fold hydrolase [Caldilineales bacterium]
MRHSEDRKATMKRNLRILVLVLLSVLVAACAVSPELPPPLVTVAQRSEDAVPRYEPLEECFEAIPEGLDYDCGYIVVPEFHGVDNGRTIKLAVLRFRSPAETPADPLFVGTGGPGQSAIPGGVLTAFRLQDSESFMSKLLDTRDLVYFSQRGTAYSQPDLSCPVRQAYAERVSAGGATAEDLRQLVSDAMLDCYQDAVDAGIDLAAYNSLENAADVNSIREVLGYDQIVYYGQSYGTLLGQHLLRDFPEALSAVILDGVVPIDAVVYEEKVDERFAYALGQLLDLCAADAACAQSFPTPAEDIEEVYQQLQTDPYELITQSGAILPVDGVSFATSLFDSLYSPVVATDLPVVIDAILTPHEGAEIDPAVSRFLTGAVPGEGIAQLMHFAIVCAEDPIDSIEEAKSLVSPASSVYAAFAEADAADYVQMCAAMDLPVLPDETDALVSSDIPVLLLHGGLDPATPEYLAEQITSTLPNNYSFVFPYGGHVQGMTDACSQSIIAQFLVDPLTKPEGSCLQEFDPPDFHLPG